MVTAAIVSKTRSDEGHDLTDHNTDVIGRLCIEATFIYRCEILGIDRVSAGN
jgi:hypothetical protein